MNYTMANIRKTRDFVKPHGDEMHLEIDAERDQNGRSQGFHEEIKDWAKHHAHRTHYSVTESATYP